MEFCLYMGRKDAQFLIVFYSIIIPESFEDLHRS